MALISIVVACHEIILTISNEMFHLPTFATLLLSTRVLIGMMTYHTIPITLDQSRSLSLTWILLTCSFLSALVSKSHIRLSSKLHIPFILTKTLIVSRSGSTILIINYALIQQHRKLERTLISNTLLNLWLQSILKMNTLRTFRRCIIIIWTKLHQFLKLGSVLNNS